MMGRMTTILIVCACLLPAAMAHGQSWCNIPKAEALRFLRHEVERKLAPKPRAVPRIHTEGTLPHQGIRDESLEAEKDWPVMRDLALLWLGEHRQSDLDALAQLLSAWGTIYKPSFDPIDETNLDSFIDAYAMTRDDLPAGVRKVAERWIRRLDEGYLDRMENGFKPSTDTWKNNWNSHRVKLVVLASAALDDATLWQRARNQFKAQIDRNLRADGSTIDFALRDALHYVTYDLDPLLRAAIAAHGRNEDWLSMAGANGANLGDAVDWLTPYATGAKTHEEFVHSTVKFDYQRRSAGVSGFAGTWNRQLAAPTYAMASMLDDKYRAVAASLKPVGGWMAACWGIAP